jgi:uncharacterized protein with PQ loop repeat
MELAGIATANEQAQLVLMSRQVIHAMQELLSRVIAEAIAGLMQNFNWSRVTIVADIADKYFLHSAEAFYRMSISSQNSSNPHQLSNSNLLQLRDSHSDVEEFLDKVDGLNLKIIVLSLRPHLASKLLCRAHERHLVWPEYAWIVHSVEVGEESCGGNSTPTLDGVISLHLKDSSLIKCCDISEGIVDLQYATSCHLSREHKHEVTLQQFGNEVSIIRQHPYPSDLPPQYVATVYIAVFYTAISVCFTLCTIMLVLFICFRKEPAVKATSVSLSILIFIGCYILVLHTYLLNSSLLPSLYRQSSEWRNCMCTLRTFLNGVGFPIALILSTLLVKLLRVYRLFRLKRRVSRFTTSNLALAMYVLLLTLPNIVISVLWSVIDPYTSTTTFSIRKGLLHISVQCVSTYPLLWSGLLLVYMIIISLVLIVFAALTRNIKYRDFKDTKKVSILSFLLVFTCASFLFYWYLLRAIKADVIFVHTLLQVGYYCMIMECQGFIFAPKLIPIVKKKLIHRYFNRPVFPPKIASTFVTPTHS